MSAAQLLTLPLLVEAVGGSEEALLGATTLRLSALALSGALDRLELCSSLTTLHLNDNLLTSLEGVEVLARLRYLDVSFNRLTSLQPCALLRQLQYLDARSNSLAEVSAALPPSLRMLRLAGNPCCAAPRYREGVLLLLPGLVELDQERVAPAPAGGGAASGGGGGGDEAASLSAIAQAALQRSRARQAADAEEAQRLQQAQPQ
jgi:hypothetical protein